MDADLRETLDLLAWRRRVCEMYRQVRNNPEPAAAWVDWRRSRDDLFRTSPQSPVERRTFDGLSYFDYDPAFRVTARVEAAEAGTWSFDATEGTLVLDCVGRACFTL